MNGLQEIEAALKRCTMQLYDVADKLEQLKEQQPSAALEWNTLDAMPEDGELVWVITKSGAVYREAPIGGQFVSKVAGWLRLPSTEKILKGEK